jgi:hypothetical protein
VPAVVVSSAYEGIGYGLPYSPRVDLGLVPDSQVAAGPRHLIAMALNAIGAVDKSTGAFTAGAPQSVRSFFAPAVLPGQTRPIGFYDPIAAYDEDVGRFLVGSLEGPVANPSYFDFAVSDGPDPTLGFTQMRRIDLTERASDRTPLWADFDHIGWNHDAYVVAFNMFRTDDFSFDHVQILVIPKVNTTLFDARPTPFPSYRWDVPEPAPFFNFSLQPAVMHGSAPGAPLWLVEKDLPERPDAGELIGVASGGNTVRVLKMTFQTNARGRPNFTVRPRFTPFSVPVAPYTAAPEATQPTPTSLPLDTLDTRMLKAEWRGNRLVATHSVGLATDTLVHARWYEFDTGTGVPRLTQQQTLNPGGGLDTWCSSIAIAPNGDLGMTYLGSSRSQPMAMYVTGQSQGSRSGMGPGRLVQGSTGYYTFGGFADRMLWSWHDTVGTPLSVGRFLSVSAGTDEAGQSVVYGILSYPDPGDPHHAFDRTLWAWREANQQWAQLSSGYFRQVSAAPGGVAYAIVDGGAVDDLWKHGPSSWSLNQGWTRLSVSNFLSVSAGTDEAGLPVAYGILSYPDPGDPRHAFDRTLWAWREANQQWVELSSGHFRQVSAAPGGVAYAIVDGGAVDDLWKHGPSSWTLNQGWSRLSVGNFLSIGAGTDEAGLPVAYGIVSYPAPGDPSYAYDQTLWAWREATQQWVELSSGHFRQVSATAGGVAYALLTEGAVDDLWKHGPSSWTLNRGWTRLSYDSYESLSATTGAGGQSKVYATSLGVEPARTGDVSSIAIDPVTGTFWAVNEYIQAPPPQNGPAWNTKIAEFSIQAPPGGTGSLPSAPVRRSATGPTDGLTPGQAVTDRLDWFTAPEIVVTDMAWTRPDTARLPASGSRAVGRSVGVTRKMRSTWSRPNPSAGAMRSAVQTPGSRTATMPSGPGGSGM